MAGHSKFKNIMYRKGAQDAKRAKLFAKLAREISVAAKSGMPEPDKNPRLKNAIINAEKIRITFEVSLKRRCRYSGIVSALYFSVCSRNFSAIRYQEQIIPIIIPNTDHNSPIPIVIAAPGRAKSSQADSPEALSEKAVTQGPSFLPAKK